MSSFGHLMICLAAVLSAAGGSLALAGGKRPALMEGAKKLLHAAAAASVVSLLVLLFLLLAHDYGVDYVRDYADRTMSIAYLVTAVWGGKQGSLLVWAALQAICTSAVAAWGGGPESKRLMPIALGFLAIVQIFFLMLVLFHSNPFELLGTTCVKGVGMNPLLRNPYMAVHPPTLFLGFVGFSVPMAFAIAALAEGKINDLWLEEQRPWILVAWVFLSIGNLLGMVWAYQELGWGGYWGWDPVENASFMPWLTGTALVHSAMVQKQRGKFAHWNIFLILATFSLIIFGTFITRSGVIESVHTFSGATTGPFLLGMIIATILVTVSLQILRRKELDSGEEESLFTISLLIGAVAFAASVLVAKLINTQSVSLIVASILGGAGIAWTAFVIKKRPKEWTFYITNAIFVFSALFVLLATMAPFLSEMFKGEKVAITPQFYNKWMVPLGLAILTLIGVCLVMGYRSRIGKTIIKRAVVVLAAGIASAAIAAFSGVIRTDVEGLSKIIPVISVGIIGAVTAAIIQQIFSIATRSKSETKTPVGLQRRLGAHMVHISIVMMFIGFTGSAFTLEKQAVLTPGKTMQIGDYELKLRGLRIEENYERQTIHSDLEITQNGKSLGIAEPARSMYFSHPNQPTSEVEIRTGLFEDLFLIFGDGDLRFSRAMIKAVVNPMVMWIWIGGFVLVLGTMIALTPLGILRHKKAMAKVSIVIAGVGSIATVIGTTRDLATAVISLAGIFLLVTMLMLGAALMAMAKKEQS